MKKELIKNMVSLLVGEALLEFIENPTLPNIVNDLREKYSEKILSVIDSLQEEPVSEDKFVSHEEIAMMADKASKECEVAIDEEFERLAISEDLEQAIDTYLAIYFGSEKEKQDWPFLKKMAIHFANWQIEQLLAKAVIGEICEDNCGSLYVHAPIPCLNSFSRLDIVRVLIIKED